MRRPGYLSGGHMKPRQLGGVGSTLGYFGKGSMNLPPSAPSGPVPPGYTQDPKCPTGQKTVTQPCSGGDCDPGETENSCQPDPEYSRLQQTSQARTQTQSVSPSSRNVQSSPQPAQTDTWAPPPSKASAEELAAMQSVFTQLQSQRDKTGKMVTMVPTISNRYTGSPVPTAGRSEKSAPTDEEKIASIASEHETQKAISRASDASTSAPSGAAPTAEPSGPPPGPPPPPPGGIISWLQNALFGSPAPSLGGLGQVDDKFSSFNNLILPIIIIMGIIYLMRKNEPALRQPRKRR